MDAEIEAKKETDGEVSLGDIVESEFTEEREGRKVFLYFECHLVKMGNPTLLEINDWNNIKSQLSRYTHTPGCLKGSQRPYFSSAMGNWVYINKNTNSSINTSNDMLFFCFSS